MTLPKWLMSSADEQKLALTIKGLLTGIIPVILLVSNVRGWHLTETDLDQIIDTGLHLLSIATTLVASIMTLVGLVRKIVIANQNGSQNNDE